MMGNKLWIHGIWGSRATQWSEAVELVSHTIKGLTLICEPWSVWYRTYATLDEYREPAIPINGDKKLINDILLRGQTHSDDGKVMPECGYMFRAFAGPAKGRMAQTTQLQLRCNRTDWTAGPNILSMQFPDAEDRPPQLNTLEVVSHAIQLFAKIWDPDGISARNIMDNPVDPPWTNGPVPGWVTYFSPRVCVVDRLPQELKWWDNEKTVFYYDHGVPSRRNTRDQQAFERLMKMVQWKARSQD